MKHKWICPSCQTKVSFLKLMSYVPPFTMKCNNCKERMQVEKSPVVSIVILFTYLMSVLVYFTLKFGDQIQWFQGFEPPMVTFALVGMIVIVTEGIIYFLYQTYKIQLIKENSFLSKHYLWTLIVPIVILVFLMKGCRFFPVLL
ncbi:hypothetical protein [Leptospira jelokensis]|uniref:hypothetical protein n=1 Tax=Leptospira jelokensis TaxID=2484931 RepID=UPI001090FADD|nr:hypothetical protein [Leptospira jelokensis]TGM01859.1 hypothetical protein EHQ79_10685 [Leptospira jelokensis]